MRLTISLDEELYAFVKARSRSADQSMSAVISELIRHAKEPRIEPHRVVSVRDGLPSYPGGDPSVDVAKLIKQLEEEDDLAALRRGGWKP